MKVLRPALPVQDGKGVTRRETTSWPAPIRSRGAVGARPGGESLCKLSDQSAKVACRWYNLTHRKAVHSSTVYYCHCVMVRIPGIWLCV